MRFASHSLSSEGGRALNEDCSDVRALDGGFYCWVVADGLGGHAGGEVASRTAVEACLEKFSAAPELSPECLRSCLEAAQGAVLERQRSDTKLAGMRTTIVVLVSDGTGVLWAHIGDTRLYFFRDGRLEFQTKDHSVPQAMVDGGELQRHEIRHHEDRNRLLREIGGNKEFRPNIEAAARTLAPGDAFLLCTDGFWEYVTETEMEIELSKSAGPEDWLRSMESRLRRAVASGNDNYSATGIFVEA
jgi:PPM family protein phosphatase